jgi:hypothetical protein
MAVQLDVENDWLRDIVADAAEQFCRPTISA